LLSSEVKQGRIEKPSWLAVLYSTFVHTEPIFPRWYHSPLGVLNNVDELERHLGSKWNQTNRRISYVQKVGRCNLEFIVHE
jgi:hypothetical protein